MVRSVGSRHGGLGARSLFVAAMMAILGLLPVQPAAGQSVTRTASAAASIGMVVLHRGFRGDFSSPVSAIAAGQGTMSPGNLCLPDRDTGAVRLAARGEFRQAEGGRPLLVGFRHPDGAEQRFGESFVSLETEPSDCVDDKGLPITVRAPDGRQLSFDRASGRSAIVMVIMEPD